VTFFAIFEKKFPISKLKITFVQQKLLKSLFLFGNLVTHEVKVKNISNEKKNKLFGKLVLSELVILSTN